ncbi:MAG TPA: alpha-glucuronidase family glycosyl hydrolase, partial [Sphingomicrobium sp.]|nr:alpha-glucuronidase family glycosyl hydrolase [Sphingomicrobium sp.]
MRALTLVILVLALAAPSNARAEDGYDLWLRYAPVTSQAREHYRQRATAIMVPNATPTLAIAG